jgi:hypothetical protein
MSNIQFLTTLCLPLVVILAGFYFQNTGLRDLRSDMGLRFARFDQRFDDLTSNVIDIDKHLIRLKSG